MKIKYLSAIMAAIPLVGLTSCLDFDDPSDEFRGDEVVVQPDNKGGNADKLDYLTPRTFDEAMAAVEKMGPEIQMIKAAQYYAKGSKEGRPTDTNAYQYFTAMTVDPYAGFWINAQSWTGRFVSTGSYYQEFLDGPYSHFTSAKNQVGSFLNSSYSDSVPELKAVALTVFNYSAAAALDLYGSIPYFDHKKNQTINPYKFDKGRDVYEAIVANLNSINACLKNFPNRPDDYRDLLEAVMMDCDGITKDKKFETWRRFANSLKLRLAMHMVKVDIDSAKKWAEEAVAEGVIESYDQEVGIMSATGSNTNPIFGVANQWGDSRCCAQFETLLASLNHPFKDMWFNENPAAIVSVWDSNDVMEPNTRVVGIRLGLAMPGGQGIANNKMFAYSTARADETLPNGEYYTSQINFAPLYFMKLSEVEFLRAEGALRGWNMGGDAQYWYEKGIRDGQISDRDNGVVTHHWADYVDDYMALEQAVPYKYIDPMDDENNEQSPTTIGVKWNPSDSREVMLEKIITQKYISLFPSDGYEAWTELRRTGYPKLLPIFNLDEYSDGSLHDGDIIRRIPLPGRDTSLGLADIQSSGIEALGGSDTQGTRVFWDVEGSNF